MEIHISITYCAAMFVGLCVCNMLDCTEHKKWFFCGSKGNVWK